MQISTNGADSSPSPKWRRDGKELFYLDRGQLMAVDVAVVNGVIRPGVPHILFRVNVGGWPTDVLENYFDVTNDGQRFLFNMPSDDAATSAFTVLLNWHGLLKR
jgi:hypothetical protein